MQMKMRTLAWVGCAALLVVAGVTLTMASQHDRGGDADGRDRPSRRLFFGPGMGDGRLGVSIRDTEPGTAGSDTPKGAVIQAVQDGSPAAKAGLQDGDRIVEFDGEAVRSARHLVRLVSETPPDRNVRVTVIRESARLDVDVTLEARHARAWQGFGDFGGAIHMDMPEIAIPDFELPDFEFEMRTRQGRLGLSVQPLGDQLAEYFGVDHGVLITSVRQGGPGADAGLRAGDVITRIAGNRVAGVGDVWRSLGADREDGAPLDVEIVRDRQSLTVSVTLPSTGRRARGEPI